MYSGWCSRAGRLQTDRPLVVSKVGGLLVRVVYVADLHALHV
jgi:hypothetical protein